VQCADLLIKQLLLVTFRSSKCLDGMQAVAKTLAQLLYGVQPAAKG
jgi:hypothetical protein